METPAVTYPSVTLPHTIKGADGKSTTVDVTTKLSLEFADWASAEEKLNISLLGPDSEAFWSAPAAHRTAVLLFVACHRARGWKSLDEARNAITWENNKQIEAPLTEACELWNGRISRAQGIEPAVAEEVAANGQDPLASANGADLDGNASNPTPGLT